LQAVSRLSEKTPKFQSNYSIVKIEFVLNFPKDSNAMPIMQSKTIFAEDLYRGSAFGLLTHWAE